MWTILAVDDRNNLSTYLYFCAQYLLVTTEIMSACLYLCVVYLLVTTEIICLHVCILCAQYFQVTTDIVCAQVCIYVRNTNWWRQKWYVCISVFMCTILAGDDRNNMPACLYLCVQCLLGTTEIIYMSACVYFCAQYLMVTTEIMSACLYLCVGYVLVTTEIICLHVCINVYNTSCWGQSKYVYMSVFMCTILAGDDRNKMSACVYFSAQYLLVTTRMICLHVRIYV